MHFVVINMIDCGSWKMENAKYSRHTVTKLQPYRVYRILINQKNYIQIIEFM